MDRKPVRITDLRRKKQDGEKITMLTAYDTPTARLLDGAGLDVLLVGDSVGMVMLGHDSTLPVTLDAMVHHTAAVSRGATRALVVADMPFLSYQVTAAEAIRNAGRLLQEGGAAAVKLEGGRPVADVVERLVDIGVPVMGHLGLRPQSVHQLGGYRRRGTETREAEAIIEDAGVLEAAGAFAVVLESIPAALGAHDHRAAADSHHRHRRRAGLRRPGAGERGHARSGRAGAAVRPAVRRPPGRHRSRRARLRGRRALGAFPGGRPAPRGCPPRGEAARGQAQCRLRCSTRPPRCARGWTWRGRRTSPSASCPPWARCTPATPR